MNNTNKNRSPSIESVDVRTEVLPMFMATTQTIKRMSINSITFLGIIERKVIFIELLVTPSTESLTDFIKYSSLPRVFISFNPFDISVVPWIISLAPSKYALPYLRIRLAKIKLYKPKMRPMTVTRDIRVVKLAIARNIQTAMMTIILLHT